MCPLQRIMDGGQVAIHVVCCGRAFVAVRVCVCEPHTTSFLRAATENLRGGLNNAGKTTTLFQV